jgi:hypothetical protein
MAVLHPAFSTNDLPAEMVAAVAGDAARDADRIGLFLEHLGLGATPEKPRLLPAGFLLHVGAALRLLVWEAEGFFGHRQAGLPTAGQAIRDAFRSLADPEANPADLRVAVLRLSIERFAWTGQPELGADIALEEAHEDALLDALADFLWARRPR